MYRQFLCMLWITLLVGISERPSCGQTTTANTAVGKSAVEAYHNIQVLKEIPADQLVPAMQFITYSLGVECSYCHVEGALEKDDKKTKLTARKMIQMMLAINRDNFDSKQVVTCTSCHHGAPHPVSIPMIGESGAEPNLETPSEAAATGNAPLPDVVIA